MADLMNLIAEEMFGESGIDPDAIRYAVLANEFLAKNMEMPPSAKQTFARPALYYTIMYYTTVRLYCTML